MTTEKKTIPPPSGSGEQTVTIPVDKSEAAEVPADPRPKAPYGFKAIRLTRPIMVEDVMKDYLFMPVTMNLGDLQSTDTAKGEIEKAIFLIAKMGKIPIASAMSIDARDIQEGSELGEYIASFL